MKHILTIILLYFIAEPQKVLFIGDSLTAYESGWQSIVSKEKRFDQTNLAKINMKTDWMLQTLTNHLKKNHEYSRIFIYGGVNDIFSGETALHTAQNIQKIVNLCNSYHIEPTVIIGYNGKNLLKNTWVKDKALEEKIRNEYALYQEMLLMTHDCKVITAVNLVHSDTEDGIHMTMGGHKKLAKHVLKNL
jgi:hypothetical protein